MRAAWTSCLREASRGRADSPERCAAEGAAPSSVESDGRGYGGVGGVVVDEVGDEGDHFQWGGFVLLTEVAARLVDAICAGLLFCVECEGPLA